MWNLSKYVDSWLYIFKLCYNWLYNFSYIFEMFPKILSSETAFKRTKLKIPHMSASLKTYLPFSMRLIFSPVQLWWLVWWFSIHTRSFPHKFSCVNENKWIKKKEKLFAGRRRRELIQSSHRLSPASEHKDPSEFLEFQVIINDHLVC